MSNSIYDVQIFVEDLVNKENEIQLPEDSRIRFEIGHRKFTVYVSDLQLEIYKIASSSVGNEISIHPKVNNVVKIS